MLSELELLSLATKIKDNIQKEFALIHLSQNLMNTIKVTRTTMGFEIEIPAEIYDLTKWYKEKVVVYTGRGSYAQQVDVEGGFSETHKNYVERAIKNAIVQWVEETNIKVKKVVEI